MKISYLSNFVNSKQYFCFHLTFVNIDIANMFMEAMIYSTTVEKMAAPVREFLYYFFKPDLVIPSEYQTKFELDRDEKPYVRIKSSHSVETLYDFQQYSKNFQNFFNYEIHLLCNIL